MKKNAPCNLIFFASIHKTTYLDKKRDFWNVDFLIFWFWLFQSVEMDTHRYDLKDTTFLSLPLFMLLKFVVL